MVHCWNIFRFLFTLFKLMNQFQVEGDENFKAIGVSYPYGVRENMLDLIDEMGDSALKYGGSNPIYYKDTFVG